MAEGKYQIKDVGNMNAAQISAEFTHVMELFKNAIVPTAMDVRQPDGTNKLELSHSLPDYLERFAQSTLSVSVPERDGEALTRELKMEYSSLATRYQQVERKEREGKLSTDDKSQFLLLLNNTIKLDNEVVGDIARSLGSAEELVKRKREQAPPSQTGVADNPTQALRDAIVNGDNAALEKLLGAKDSKTGKALVDPNKLLDVNGGKSTASMIAAGQGNWEALDMLRKAGADFTKGGEKAPGNQGKRGNAFEAAEAFLREAHGSGPEFEKANAENIKKIEEFLKTEPADALKIRRAQEKADVAMATKSPVQGYGGAPTFNVAMTDRTPGGRGAA
jgi:hypothetical protein